MIVGDGYIRDSLMGRVRNMGLADKTIFTGFLDEQSLRFLFQCADVCVVPSLYEPFGITALEAMAAKVPVVVSDTGGLAEIVEHDKTGVKVFANSAESLAWGINRILLDPSYAELIKSNAYSRVLETYNWSRIAEKVKILYRRIRHDYKHGSWKPT